MKKVFSLILVLAMFAALSVNVFAADSQDITVTYTAAETYTVTIPSSQTFAADSLTSTGTVSAKVLLEAGKVLNVLMNSANGFVLKCGDSSIAYTISNGDAVLGNDDCVLEVAAGNTSGSSELTFATTEEAIAAATIAGEHTDTVTFTCSLKESAN